MKSFASISRRLCVAVSITVAAAVGCQNVMAMIVVDLAPSHDTYVVQNSPTSTHGAETKLTAQENSASTDTSVVYLQFDLASLGIGDPSLITSAVLNMRQQSTTILSDVPDPGVFLYRVPDDGWDEATLDWNGRPTLDALLERKNLRMSPQENAASGWRQWDLLAAGNGTAWSPATDLNDGALSLGLFIGDHASSLVNLSMTARYLSGEDFFDPAFLQLTIVPLPAALPLFGVALLGLRRMISRPTAGA